MSSVKAEKGPFDLNQLESAVASPSKCVLYSWRERKEEESPVFMGPAGILRSPVIIRLVNDVSVDISCGSV
jgi:hypothetical protein